MLRRALPIMVLAIILCLAVTSTLLAQAPDDDASEKAIADRFLKVLEKNPRPGTSFDKVYAHHAERGTLEDLLKRYRDKAENGKSSEAATGWMIVGLVESQRGKDAEAIKAFSQAETLDQENAMASILLGRSLVLSGQTKEASDAYERAIQRKPAAPDLFEVYQSLGRVYHRAQKTDKALDVWNRLEQQFPNDPRVQEQIATTLLEENDLTAALPRFEKLARQTKDKYRQTQFLIEVAEIKVRLSRTEEALKDFEKLIGQLNPDNWLFHDVRRRVESLYLRSDDRDGLIAYYEAWLEKNAEDLDAAARLARLLASAGRGADAQTWLRRGLKLAPSNKDLRQTLIAQLLNDRKFHDAAEQYQELSSRDPANPDVLRDWGRTILKDTTLKEAQRQKDAAAVWRKLTAARPNDAPAAAQVADLFRHAGMTDDAIELFRRAIELAPDSEQYREYLGEYLQSLKRTDEALATWREMAADSRKSATNLARLAEILARHDQLSEAVATNDEACRLDPKDFTVQLRQVDLLSRAEKRDEALQHLASVQKIAANDEEREACLKRELQELKTLKRLTTRIADVRKELQGDSAGTAEQWFWLARAEEAADQPRSAIQAITRATALQPKSVPILTAAARLNETQQNLRAAVEVYGQLTSIDRRFRSVYLKRIAILEEKRGRRKEALEAGRELLATSPGPEAAEFLSELCFRVGNNDEAIQALRRSLRTNPGDLPTLLKLASVLAKDKQATEAVELLWRAFERSHNLNDRMTVVQQLARVHAQLGQAKRLYARLERESREPARRREMTLCLAQAYESTGELALAQSTLESLLADEARDAVLLGRLRSLAEQQRDFESVIRYQRQLWKITGNEQDGFQLAQLLLLHGDVDEAVDLLAGTNDSRVLNPDVLRLLDNLEYRGRHREAIGRVRRLRKAYPDNWELLYREGVFQLTSSPEAARKCFEELLKLDTSENDVSLLGPTRQHDELPTETRLPLIERFSEIMRVSQSDFFTSYRTKQSPVIATAISHSNWMPSDYGLARIAAWNWLRSVSYDLKIDQNKMIAASFPKQVGVPSRQKLIDQIIVYDIASKPTEMWDALRQLIRQSEDDIEARVLFLKMVEKRHYKLVGLSGNGVQPVKCSEPLTEELLDKVQKVYEEVAARRDLIPLNVTLLRGLIAELTLAGRPALANKYLMDAVANVTTPIEVSSLLALEHQAIDFEMTLKLLDRLLEMPHLALTSTAASAQTASARSALKTGLPEQFIRRLLPELWRANRTDDMLQVWDRYIKLCASESAHQLIASTPGASLGALAFMDSLDQSEAIPGFVLAADTIPVLRLIRRYFHNQDRDNELIAKFKASCQSNEQTVEERLHRQHSLAFLMWLGNDREEAISVLVNSVKELPARKELRFRLIKQFDVMKRPAMALAMLDTVTADSLDEQRELEKLAFRLAMAANQFDRTKLAAERVSTISSDVQEISVISRQLLQSGLKEQAEVMLIRTRESRSLEWYELRTLMDAQLALGKTQEATATATEVLDQVRHASGTTMRAKKLPHANATGYKVIGQPALKPVSESQDGLRTHCLRLLHETGRLAEMIESEEKVLQAEPGRVETINQLISYYSAARNKAKIKELVAQRNNLQADAPAARYAAALKHFESGQSREALAELKLLINRVPDYVASRCRETVLTLEGRKELSEFIGLLEQTDWGSNETKLTAFAAIVEHLRALPSTAEKAEPLFIKVWQAHPEIRIDLLHRCVDDHWWEVKQVRDDMASLLVPAANVRGKSRWRVLGHVMQSPEVCNRLDTVWNRLLSQSADVGMLDEIAKEVERGIEQMPDWTEGEVLLAMIDLRRGRIEAGRDAFDKLLPQLESRLHTRPVIAWEIAQELVRHEESLTVGTKYFQVAIRWSDNIDWTTASSPAGALIDVHLSHGRITEARRLLLQSVPENLRFHPTSVLNPPKSEIAQALSIGHRLRALDAPIDAIEVYQAALQRLGGDPNLPMQTALVVMFGELKADSLVQYVEEFDGAYQQMHLYPFVHQSDSGQSRIQCQWDSLLHEITKDSALTARTQKAFDRLIEKQADKITPLVMSAQLSFAVADRDKSAAAAARLLGFLSERPPEQIPAVLSPNDQRGLSSSQVGVWLIARECLMQPTLAQIGNQLGQRALDASRADPTAQFTIAMLREWIEIADQTGDTDSEKRVKLELEKIQEPLR